MKRPYTGNSCKINSIIHSSLRDFESARPSNLPEATYDPSPTIAGRYRPSARRLRGPSDVEDWRGQKAEDKSGSS